jgi:hypothetical protein
MIKLDKDKVIPSVTEDDLGETEGVTKQPAPTPDPEDGELGIKDKPKPTT